jgi:hypothetical protein
MAPQKRYEQGLLIVMLAVQAPLVLCQTPSTPPSDADLPKSSRTPHALAAGFAGPAFGFFAMPTARNDEQFRRFFATNRLTPCNASGKYNVKTLHGRYIYN